MTWRDKRAGDGGALNGARGPEWSADVGIVGHVCKDQHVPPNQSVKKGGGLNRKVSYRWWTGCTCLWGKKWKLGVKVWGFVDVLVGRVCEDVTKSDSSQCVCSSKGRKAEQDGTISGQLIGRGEDVVDAGF